MSTWVAGYVRCDQEPVFPVVDDQEQVPWNWLPTEKPLHYLMAERPQWDGETPKPFAVLDDPAIAAAGGYQIGAWDFNTKKPHGSIDQAAYEAMRPLGNSRTQIIRDPETGEPIDSVPAGLATHNLRAQTFAGAGQVYLGDPEATGVAALYPADNQPFDLEFRHWYFENPAAPAADGWGFVGEMHGDASLRDPSVRSVGAFTDDTYTGVLWPTTGAFIRGPSRWQTDENGDPLEVWYIESWDGYRQEEKIDWHIAVLYASIQEGRAFLPASSDGIRYLFWEHTQGGGGGSEWVETGATVTSIIGAAVYGVDTSAPFDGMAAGTPLRIGGEETTFTRVHAHGIIVVGDHNAAAVGEMIWSQ